MSHALKEDDECVDRVPEGSPGPSRVGKDQSEDQDEADRPPEPPHAVQRARSGPVSTTTGCGERQRLARPGAVRRGEAARDRRPKG